MTDKNTTTSIKQLKKTVRTYHAYLDYLYPQNKKQYHYELNYYNSIEKDLKNNNLY